MTNKKKTIVKILVSAAAIGAVVLMIYLVFKQLGITELSRESLQAFIEETGVWAPIIYVIISFLQVTFVPLPGSVTILAGNYVFGALETFFYSYIGMMIGSLVAYWLGRKIGRPFVNWLAGGKDEADGWIVRLKGRETVFLFFAFFLPLFPDDLLCSIAGILPMRFGVFLGMQLVTRTTSIGATLLFMSGEVIPYEGWGLVVLAILAVLAIAAFIVCMKHADKLNALFDKAIDKLVHRGKKKEKAEETEERTDDDQNSGGGGR